MAKKTKIRLQDLKVQSFVTSLSSEESQRIKAGDVHQGQIVAAKESRIAISLFNWVCGCLAY